MKKFLVVTSIALTTFLVHGYAEAEESVAVDIGDKTIEFNFEESGLQELVEEEHLEAIAKQALEDDDTTSEINIYDVTLADEFDDEYEHNFLEESVDDGAYEKNEDLFTPFASWSVTRQTKNTGLMYAAQQIISVPYGAKKKLTSKFSTTNARHVTLSAGGSWPSGLKAATESGLRKTTTKTISTSVSFSGPAKGYKSRIYYVTRYYDNGSWTGRNGKKRMYGNFTHPSQTAFVEWSRDIK